MTTAIILAGGRGTRLKSVVSEVPKPLALIDGRPFLEYQLSFWIKQGVSRFIFSIGYKAQKIIDHFGVSYAGIPIDYAVENFPLGTGGGLLKAIKYVDHSEPVLVLNGDTIFTICLKDLIQFSFQKKSDWTVAIKKININERYGSIHTNSENKIISIDKTNNSNFINSGVYLINSNMLKEMKLPSNKFLSLEDTIFKELLKLNSNLYGIVFDDYFIDIGIPSDYFIADKVLRTKIDLLN